MFYFVVIMAALAWILLGFVGAYALNTKSQNNDLEEEVETLSGRLDNTRASLAQGDRDYVDLYFTLERVIQERDDAQKCLEMVLDESLKEPASGRT